MKGMSSLQRGEKIRILEIIDSVAAGGKERRFVELLKALVQRDDLQIEVVVFDSDIHYRELLDFGLRIHYVIRHYKRDPRPLVSIANICMSFHPHIVHAWDSMTAMYAAPIARLLGSRFVNGLICDADPDVKPFTKAYVRSRVTFPMSDAIVGNSAAGLTAYAAPAEKSHLIHNGYDFSRTQNLQPIEQVRRIFDIRTNAVVGMVATFSPLKDYETYFEAATIILESLPDVTFIAVGDGEQREQLEAKYKGHFPDRVRFIGWVDDVESVIQVFDVGVLASTAFGEGISNSILEYMAMARPVVATACAGTKELVIDGTTGYLTKVGDSAELAVKIAELLVNSRLREQMGASGLERARTLFDISKMSRAYMDLFVQMVHRA